MGGFNMKSRRTYPEPEKLPTTSLGPTALGNPSTQALTGIKLDNPSTQALTGRTALDNLSIHALTGLGMCFGLQQHHLYQWPGLIAFHHYLESAFEPLMQGNFQHIWRIVDLSSRPPAVEDCWQLFTKILRTCQSYPSSDNDASSILDLVEELMKTSSKAGEELDDANRQACCVVLATLFWATMTIKPKLDSENTQGMVLEGLPTIKMEYMERPIKTLFEHLYECFPPSRWRHPIGGNRDHTEDSIRILHVTSLNYSCLWNIGKITIRWVDNICEHLDFDAKSRKLSLFKFPSFCALSIEKSTQGSNEKSQTATIIEGIIRGLYNDRDSEASLLHQAHQEIFMSYRLIFGQSVRARKKAKKEMKKLKDMRDMQFDELLITLCTHSYDSKIKDLPATFWPVTCLNYEGKLQESNTYSAQDDFPLFGQRLVKLQEFITRQEPSKLRDLWRDRRNPLQWYTFWAVLLFGAWALLLGITQVALSVAQLYVSYLQLQASPP